MNQELADRIRAKASELGFAEMRVTTADVLDGVRESLASYLAEGRHGDMGWMETSFDRRPDPKAYWPQARSIVLLGENYGPSGDPMAKLEQPERGNISVYAQGRDYHLVLKRRLKALARWMEESVGAAVRPFVDTAPVMEKPLAARAGLGWQGRHTNLVSRRFGSWLFLGGILTDLDLPSDVPERDHCGSCRNCESACPTGALEGGHIDPRLCISYLTIEHKGHIPTHLRQAFGNRIYGCDDCLSVCPWNKFATPTAEPDYLPRAELMAPRLADLAQLDDAAFREMFSGSPIKRLGRDRFIRNVLIAIGNSGDVSLGRIAVELLIDQSPLVRAMAVWAARRLLGEVELGLLADRHFSAESDPDVRTEWAGATSADR